MGPEHAEFGDGGGCESSRSEPKFTFLRAQVCQNINVAHRNQHFPAKCNVRPKSHRRCGAGHNRLGTLVRHANELLAFSFLRGHSRYPFVLGTDHAGTLYFQLTKNAHFKWSSFPLNDIHLPRLSSGRPSISCCSLLFSRCNNGNDEQESGIE